MCGRLNVDQDPLNRAVSALLGITYQTVSNPDLRPSERVDALVSELQGYRQQPMTWGIQPGWSRRLLINAQAETAAVKPTFKQALGDHRCLIPCSGWYEWRAEGGGKQKYLFRAADEAPLYMAGLWYPADSESELPRLVTLTTVANAGCQPYHPRMPLLVLPAAIPDWFSATAEQLAPLLLPVDQQMLEISRC